MTGMPRLGKLFVFEGPDGSGKTTLSRTFVEYLKGKDIACDLFAFPGMESGTLGKHVYELHHNPESFGIREINPTSTQLLHVAAHIDALETSILPAIKSGRWVVLDRFWWSTLAYGRLAGADERSLEAMIEIERQHWGAVRPAAVFLVLRNTSPACPTNRWTALLDEYLRIARATTDNRVYLIHNDGKMEEGLSELVAKVENALSKKPQKEPRLSRDGRVASLAFRSLRPAKPTLVFDTYWRFAAERQAIFFRRLAGAPEPWTSDPILKSYKFTNAYRASDRVSQYLIREVLYRGDQNPEDLFFRTLLFKIFNRIGTWTLLTKEVGCVTFKEYKFERYDRVLSRALARGTPVYSGAYMMPSDNRSEAEPRKHRFHLRLLEQMMKDEIPARCFGARSMREAFELLRSYPTLGNFLAYQYVIDLNYSALTNFSEMEFVVAGPGARDGIRKCFSDLGGLTETEIITLVTERQEEEFGRCGLTFDSLWGRSLQLVDCQNLFCEVDKYARIRHPEYSGITGRTRIKQRYKCNPTPIEFWYPPKWGLNDRIPGGGADVSCV